MISTNASACGRGERRSMRLVVVVGRFHLHHGATRIGSLVRIRMWMVRMIFTSWPAREESLISPVGIYMGRRSRSVRLVMRVVVLRQGGVAVPHVLLMIRIVVKASALGIPRVEIVAVVIISRARHSAASKALMLICKCRLAVLVIGKVIHRYLPGRQELRLLVLVLVRVVIADLCRRGASMVAVAVIAPLPARSDRRRAAAEFL